MDKLVIEGGIPLKGEVRISGAKNAALPILAATLLAEGRHLVRNVPRLRDIKTIGQLLERLGARVDTSGMDRNELMIETGSQDQVLAPYELVRTMRASILVLGPLLARAGRAEVSLPGGCAIGTRPVDQHLKGLEALGATIEIRRGYIHAETPGLKGAEFTFDVNTVTGTENLMMAACLAEGTTVLGNAACEPEIGELAGVLIKMGADIRGAGTEEIVIQGVAELKPINHSVMPDRVEAATYMAAAAITNGELFLQGACSDHLHSVISKFREAGVELEEKDGGILARADGLKSVDVKTSPFPGFPTDVQAQIMAMMCMAEDGLSVITETVFENRFMHVLELKRMGAEIKIRDRSAIVSGVDCLEGAAVMATDLRASASLVLAGLAARNTTEVLRIYHLDRGYENMEEKLVKVGARIKREEEGA